MFVSFVFLQFSSSLWQFMRITFEFFSLSFTPSLSLSLNVEKYNFPLYIIHAYTYILITRHEQAVNHQLNVFYDAICNFVFLGHFKGQRILASICLWPKMLSCSYRYCCRCYCDLSAAPAATGNCLKMPNVPLTVKTTTTTATTTKM